MYFDSANLDKEIKYSKKNLENLLNGIEIYYRVFVFKKYIFLQNMTSRFL